MEIIREKEKIWTRLKIERKLEITNNVMNVIKNIIKLALLISFSWRLYSFPYIILYLVSNFLNLNLGILYG
jgi:hypothetical protein